MIELELQVNKAWNQITMDDIALTLPNFDMQRFEDVNMKQVIRGLYRFLCYEQQMATFPSDWWQAVKEKWFPKWLLNRCPVRYTVIIAEHRFPETVIPLGREKVVLRYEDIYSW